MRLAPGLSSPDNLTQETCGPCDSVKSETRPGHKEANWLWPPSPLQQPACPRASARGCRRQLGQEAHPTGSKRGACSVRTVGCPPTHGHWHPGTPPQGGPSCPTWGRTAASLWAALQVQRVRLERPRPWMRFRVPLRSERPGCAQPPSASSPGHGCAHAAFSEAPGSGCSRGTGLWRTSPCFPTRLPPRPASQGEGRRPPHASHSQVSLWGLWARCWALTRHGAQSPRH